jgi:CxxC-x17-CxxC domain-containing protein
LLHSLAFLFLFLSRRADRNQLRTFLDRGQYDLNDQILSCRDCGQAFTFTVGEQEFFASRGFDNSPTRCPDCRAARKAERGGSSYGSGGGYERREREMFSAVCSQCGKEALVPFQPRGDKPVYCSDCFSAQRGASQSYTRARSGSGW